MKWHVLTPSPKGHAGVSRGVDDRSEAVEWARRLIAEGVPVLGIRSSAGDMVKVEDFVTPPRGWLPAADVPEPGGTLGDPTVGSISSPID